MITVLKLNDVNTTLSIDRMTDNDPDFWEFVRRCRLKYTKCEWGDTDQEQKTFNDRLISKRRDGWLVAKYFHPKFPICIMTEINRVEEIYKTTIMLESEFNAKGMNRYSCKQQKYNRHGEV